LPAGTTAVALNVIASGATSAGHLTVYPAGTTRPAPSSLHFTAGTTAAGLVVVAVHDGKVAFYNSAAGSVQVTADLQGYYLAGAGYGYQPVTPTRVLDTHRHIGVATTTPIPAHSSVTFTLGPSDHHGAALTVTVSHPTAAGGITVYGDPTRPATSNLHFAAGTTVSGQVFVDGNGQVTIYNGTSGTLDLTADLHGWFVDDGLLSALSTPTRAIPPTTIAGGATITVPLGPAAAGVAAVLATTTALDATTTGSLTVGIPGSKVTPTTDLAWAPKQVISNLTVLPVADGKVTLTNHGAGSVTVIVDVIGVYGAR
jgi:hypothetical protein